MSPRTSSIVQVIFYHLRSAEIFREFKNNFIRITCPCDLYPLTPHFYIVKLGCTEVFVFSYFSSNT